MSGERGAIILRIIKVALEAMNRLALLGAMALLAGPAHAGSITDKFYNACKDAKNYASCVIEKVRGLQEPAQIQEECWKNSDQSSRSCLAGSGDDRFGLPKKQGWIYWMADDGRLTYNEWDGKTRNASGHPVPMVHQVPHKGEVRYLAFRGLWRSYSNPNDPFVLVVDCKEDTIGVYKNGNQQGSWVKSKTGKNPYCGRIAEYPVLDLNL